ncbi:putative ard1 family protein [Dioszegia hungarica]|uniref:Ard1 family protein n=1 Tax=Dioszegia hungarica TaxID=4972 RepID=A0AA38LVY0_9TREE|nr:putative ard1 family protein [Dioszegia hungarica]KAI9637003.1 putative ard1 family protein [Dioszegia hungarica]
MDIRQATIDDLLGMQNANLLNLPENYTFKYYLYHALTWPELSYVAVDPQGRVVGYILSKMEEEPAGEPHGHVTSISVIRPYRRLGLANRLMRQAQEAMVAHYGAAQITLHVRKSNRAAISLYRDTLGFEVHEVQKSYYADGEDAYGMRYDFKQTAEAA